MCISKNMIKGLKLEAKKTSIFNHLKCLLFSTYLLSINKQTQTTQNLSIALAWIALRRIGRIELNLFVWRHQVTLLHLLPYIMLGKRHPILEIVLNIFILKNATQLPGGLCICDHASPGWWTVQRCIVHQIWPNLSCIFGQSFLVESEATKSQSLQWASEAI